MKYDLPFGTHGIRGAAHEAPFTQTHLQALGKALEELLQEQKLPPSILFGMDTRASGPHIKRQLSSGFSEAVTCFDANILPTPALIVLLTHDASIGCGIMITASHNKASDNGIKIFLQNGRELSKEHEQRIQTLFDEHFSQSKAVAHSLATINPYPSPYAIYLEHILPHFKPNFLSGLTIGLDCAHGSASVYAPTVFEHFGAMVTTINASPDGKNINEKCGSADPESLQNEVLKRNLQVGFAFDGDADRVVAVDKNGTLKDGDDLLVLLLADDPEPHSVSTKLSNSALKKTLQNLNCNLILSDVGEHAVIEQMNAWHTNLGAEPSGHIIIRKHLMSSDGIFAALSVMDAALGQKNLALETFRHYPHALYNLPVAEKIPLTHPDLARILAETKTLHPDIVTLVRYSGTENLLRIYTEAEHQNEANALAAHLALSFSKTITRLLDQQTIKEIPQEQHSAQRVA